MRKKILHFQIILTLLLSLFIRVNHVHAQTDTIPKLIITEANLDFTARAYVELTNIGDTALYLKDFGLGSLQWWIDAYVKNPPYYSRMPDDTIQPGESYLVATVSDWTERNRNPDDYPGEGAVRFTPVDYWKHVDWEIHRSEADDPTDSVSAKPELLRTQKGEAGIYIDYFFPGGGSVVIDAVNNAFGTDGRPTGTPNDVAGVFEGSAKHILVRKTTVNRGNLDWVQAAGAGAEDSEWIVIPFHPDYYNPNQKFFTTLKHHGNAEISAATLSSNTIGIDLENSVLNVPWGIYKDSIMFEFNLGKGLAWTYVKKGFKEDSVYCSTRTGDSLVIWAVGASKKEKKLRINTLPPAADMNHVLPMFRRSVVLDINNKAIVSYQRVFRVTKDNPVMDSITRVPYNQRVDTLFKYLEKPVNATWEIIWVDGNERPDLKHGDILKVTAENGVVREYFISADSKPQASSNPRLSSIIWPDIPEMTRISPIWGGKNILPGFSGGITSYKLLVPYGTADIPALQATQENLNAKISVKRATNIKGTLDERTTVFTVVAEDDSTILKYSILFEQEIPSVFLQPFFAEPLISELVIRQNSRNTFLEIANVGDQPLDMSKYLITSHRSGNLTNPGSAITWNSASYNHRYTRFVYGYDYVSEEEWAAKPGFLKIDSYDAFIEPGDVMVIGFTTAQNEAQKWQHHLCDVLIHKSPLEYTEFESTAKKIIDGDTEKVAAGGAMLDRNGGNYFDPVHIFKILNDSIFDGTKGISDPSDFELVEMIGGYTSQRWLVSNGDTTTLVGIQNEQIIRKPQFSMPSTSAYSTFDTIPELNQWYWRDRVHYEKLGYENTAEMLGSGIGYHEFSPITFYKSTIKSRVYLASDGYASPQTIKGVLTNTIYEDFLNNLIKNDAEQGLTVLSGTNGALVDPGMVIMNQDTLVVLSADSLSTTKYVISVSDEGLDDNAILIAKENSGYSIDITGSEGVIHGIVFGTTLKTVLDKLVKPSTASLAVVDQNDGLVSLITATAAAGEVQTQASHLTRLEVTAQDNSTKITYTLKILTDKPMLFSDYYTVNQGIRLVQGIPGGTRVDALFRKLYATEGAGVMLLDKAGNERTMGNVAFDDIVKVSSGDGSNTAFYFLHFIEELMGTEAYVLSDILDIDQKDKIIYTGANVTISNLKDLLIAAPGATFKVVDADGNEVTTGNLILGYKVNVTSGNGVLSVKYDLDLTSDVEKIRNIEGISAYPNPTSGEIFITGLRDECTVRVYTMLGENVKIFKPSDIHGGRISIDDQKAGIYFITVDLGNYRLKTLKVIKN